MVNVYLSDGAYTRLKTAKKPGQSFSDVIIEHFPMAALDFSEFLGSCKGLNAKRTYAQIKKERR